jgi:hypothetical protein
MGGHRCGHAKCSGTNPWSEWKEEVGRYRRAAIAFPGLQRLGSVQRKPEPEPGHRAARFAIDFRPYGHAPSPLDEE